MTWIEENYWEDSQNRRVIALTRVETVLTDGLHKMATCVLMMTSRRNER